MRSFLILVAAIVPPAWLYAALSETDFAALREMTPWALMLLGFGGLALVLRARRGPPDIERNPPARSRTRGDRRGSRHVRARGEVWRAG